LVTVKQLEHELNVSKVSLYAILKKDPFVGHVIRGDNNVIMLDDVGAKKLRAYYLNKVKGGPPNQNSRSADRVGIDAVEMNGVINVLQQQLAKKDEQIESLLGIVSGRQELHA